jgi:hypothetical protein
MYDTRYFYLEGYIRMSCHYRNYTPDEDKLNHTLDGQCWIMYMSDDGQPFSVRTSADIQQKLITGEYIVLHTEKGEAYLNHIGPGIRDKLLSEDYVLVCAWEHGKNFLLTRNMNDLVKNGSLKWVYDKDGDAFLIENAPNEPVIRRITTYKLPSDYAEGMAPHIIDYSQIPKAGGRRKSRKSRNKKRKTKRRH